VALLLLTLGGSFYAVNQASIQSARAKIQSDLDTTGLAFKRLLDERNNALAEKARFLSSDHAYRQIYAFGDAADLALATNNHRRRIKADLMLLVNFEGKTLASTLQAAGGLQSSELPPALRALLNAGLKSDRGEARQIALLHDQPYQLVILPLYAPEPVAMVILGFSIGKAEALQLKEATNGTDITLVFQTEDGEDIVAACTLPGPLCPLVRKRPLELPNGVWQLADEAYQTSIIDLHGSNTEGVAILQRSLDAELQDYYELRNTLAAIFAGSLLLAMMGASALAGLVTRPVAILSEGVKRVAQGDYTAQVNIKQRDELGDLANSFNTMSKGLEERDKVRNLLGKVVSPQIADELMAKDIELGGEERRVTILFSDVRDFTSISENMQPQQIIEMLNHYLTSMNSVIESHHGVVDKYIGDAVMALFGAPLQTLNDEHNAVACSLQMLEALDLINKHQQGQDKQMLQIGIGINTGNVVAGNMGSMSRLNYTVLGDAVNLASRLEGLCKHYCVPIIISESTRQGCPNIACRELDKVKVKGRQEPVILYQPVNGLAATLIQENDQAMAVYRSQDWRASEALFQELMEKTDDALYGLYLRRIAELHSAPPSASWQGITVFDSK